MKELPQYRCHKIVGALKISAIEFAKDGTASIASAEQYPTITVQGYRERFKGDDPSLAYEDLGYYVVYDDGYQSWSPTKAFEEGYKPVIARRGR